MILDKEKAKLYQAFMENLMGQRYRIRLSNGRVVEGVPNAPSVNPADNPWFSVRVAVDRPPERFLFSDLVEAQPIG